MKEIQTNSNSHAEFEIRIRGSRWIKLISIPMILLLCGFTLKDCSGSKDIIIEPTFQHFDAVQKTTDQYPLVEIEYQVFDARWDSTKRTEFKDLFSLASEKEIYRASKDSVFKKNPSLSIYVNRFNMSHNELVYTTNMVESLIDTIKNENPELSERLYVDQDSVFSEVTIKSFSTYLNEKVKRQQVSACFTDLQSMISEERGTFDRNHLTIIISEIPKDLKHSEMVELLTTLNERNYSWYIWVIVNPPKRLASLEFDRCFLIQNLNGDPDLIQNIIQKHNMLRDSYGSIEFKLGLLDPRRQQQQFTLSLTDVPIQEIQLNLSFDPDLLKDMYISSVIDSSRFWADEGLYREALLKLGVAVDLVSYQKFDSLTKSLVQEWTDTISLDLGLDSLIAFNQFVEANLQFVMSDYSWWNDTIQLKLFEDLKNDFKSFDDLPEFLFDFVEKAHSMVPKTARWKNDWYVSILKLLLRKLDNQDDSDYLSITAEKILNINPNDPEAGFIYNSIQGDKALSARRFNEALILFKEALSFKQNSELSSKLGSVTTAGIKFYFDSREYSKLIELQDRWFHLADKDFANHYYVAMAADELLMSNLVVENLEWIAKHWQKDQSLITWEQLSTKLQEHYLLSGQFAKGFKFTKSVIQNDPSQIVKLYQYFLTSRAINYHSMLSLFHKYDITYGNDKMFSEFFAKLNSQSLSGYVDYFAIFNSQGKVNIRYSYPVGKIERFDNITLKNRFDVLLNDRSDPKSLTLLQPLNDGYCTVQMNDTLTGVELSLAESIEKDPENETNWFSLSQDLNKTRLDEYTYLISFALGSIGLPLNNQVEKILQDILIFSYSHLS